MTVEQAVISKLGGDATLATLAPGGIWLDVAPASAPEPYVIVRVLASEDVEALGPVRAFEDVDLLVKAVGVNASAANAQAAADRIDALLQAGTLTVTGGTLMAMSRREHVRYVEVNGDARYQHTGGVYQVVVSR